MATRAVGAVGVLKQCHAPCLGGGEGGLPAHHGVVFGVEGLQRTQLKGGNGLANLCECRGGIGKRVDPEFAPELVGVSAGGNFVHHRLRAGVVHFKRVQKRAQRLQGNGVGTSIPKMAAHGFGFSVRGDEPEGWHQALVGVGHRVANAQCARLAAKRHANARAVVARKPLVGLVAGHAGGATWLGQIAVGKNLPAKLAQPLLTGCGHFCGCGGCGVGGGHCFSGAIATAAACQCQQQHGGCRKTGKLGQHGDLLHGCVKETLTTKCGENVDAVDRHDI